ncbi:MAG: hypothetical protein GY811_13530, partial [Myxococcales bacterium]|nr:hypothetical protein [Myxococcales bacterium]
MTEVAPARAPGANSHRGTPGREGQNVLDSEDPVLHKRREARSITKAGKTEALDTGLRLATISEIGTLPRTALGLGAMASAHSGVYSVSFRLTRWAEQVQFVGGGDERGGSFEMISGSLHVCREFPHAPLALGLCTIGTVARMS